MISGEGALNCYSVLLYSVGALSHPLLLPLELFVGLDGGLGEAVVVPPAGQRGTDGEACAHQLLHLGGLNGQHGLARCTEQLVGQCKAQHRRAGHGGGGGILWGVGVCFHALQNDDQLLVDQHGIQIAATIYTQARLRTSLFCFLLYQLSLWVG